MSADDFRSATYTEIHSTGNKSWCPKIYFNHKCFSGPYLSKGRIAELPKCVGPGPVVLVMKEVCTQKQASLGFVTKQLWLCLQIVPT